MQVRERVDEFGLFNMLLTNSSSKRTKCILYLRILNVFPLFTVRYTRRGPISLVAILDYREMAEIGVDLWPPRTIFTVRGVLRGCTRETNGK